MSMVYIQKKIDGKWRTTLTTDEVTARQLVDHFRKYSPQHEFRTSKDKTDDMPPEPKGLSLSEALNALYAMNLARSTPVKIANIIYEVHRRYKCRKS